uniref:DNA ligase IV n=1 Tax=Haemonchus placei TaxID=6290 RepID=A0A0N4WYZ9_HAEPC
LSTKDSRSLNIKEKKLVDRVCKALAVSSSDIPKANIPNATRVCEVLASEVASRIAPDDFEHLTIAEINERLDRMSDISGSSDLQYLFKNCSQDELFWLFNVMIKNVESTIGVATNVILSWLGPEAVKRWNAARDLSEVAATSASAESPLGANFRPMLLARLPKEGWWEVIKENSGEEFFVETKYDGEHVLMHKISRDQYKWYTRNGKDFTKDYGGSSSLTDLVSGRIHPLFRSSVTDCILDCELMLWDKRLKKLCRRQFKSQNSENRSHSFRYIDPSDNVQLAVVVFDMLYLNGKSIMNAPLHQRLRALDAGLLKDNHGHIDTISIAPRKTVSTKEEVETLFSQALAAGEEGIVVKRKDVTYQPGTRMTKSGWFKLKAYLGDNELDVAVVAIMPEKGKDGQIAYQLAVRDGMTFLVTIKMAIRVIKSSAQYVGQNMPPQLPCRNQEAPPELRGWNIDGKGGFIRKEHWMVVEMTAAGVRDGKFIDPVMRRIRYDKDIDEVDTMTTFLDYEQTLSMSKLSSKSPAKEKKKKVTKRMMAEASAVPEVEAKYVRTESPLVGHTVCVLYGTDERLRKRLMEILKKFGANVVANPVDGMSLVVATTDKHLKTRTQIEAGKATVVRGKWVLRCEEQGEVVP